ncbi:hypothetical protein [Aquabacterium sp.]|uniref:hypothetical protein n=1 Tax=Aquabacterium sp. TaxID=1872578 RepID=UPI0025BDD3C0|nr:hypothetical protein [Aquabacterium sp.]
MAIQTFDIAADNAAGVPAGSYVSAEVATRLEQSLSKLVWTVLYGKSFDASGLAVGAEKLLSDLRKGKLAA